MATSTPFLAFGTSENLSLIAIIISIIFSIITIILNRREKPNVMPEKEESQDEGKRLAVYFKNTSAINLHNLTILINGFDESLAEIKNFHFRDKYLFTIGENSTFNYSFSPGEYVDVKKKFYFRVRLKGLYITKYFLKRKFCQKIWYSAIPTKIDGDKVALLLHTTHKDEIDKLNEKYKETFPGYERIIDKKFN